MRTKITLNHCAAIIAAAGLLMMSACSKKKEEEKDVPKTPETKQAVEPSRQATPLSTPNTKAAPQIPAMPANKKAAEDMQNILQIISSGGDTITALKNGWKVFNHPALEQPADTTELRNITEGKTPLLFIELRDPASRWNTDPRLKQAVAGRLSLLMGLFGSSNPNVARFPELVGGESNETSAMEGDMVTLQIVQLAVKSIQKKMPLQDNQVPAWEGMAASPKPVDRAIALVAFNALQPTPEQANRFYSRYLKENDQEVARVFIEQLAATNTPEAIKLLQQFKSQSSSTQLAPMIDAKLLQMKGSTR